MVPFCAKFNGNLGFLQNGVCLTKFGNIEAYIPHYDQIFGNIEAYMPHYDQIFGNIEAICLNLPQYYQNPIPRLMRELNHCVLVRSLILPKITSDAIEDEVH